MLRVEEPPLELDALDRRVEEPGVVGDRVQPGQGVGDSPGAVAEPGQPTWGNTAPGTRSPSRPGPQQVLPAGHGT
jgi:hypothetical protein